MADIDWGGLLGSALRSAGQGYMYGAASYNPQILPQVIAQDPNVQAAGIRTERQNQLGNMILQGVQSGTIDWTAAQPALQKLGFPVRGMPDLGMNNQSDALAQVQAAIGQTMGGGGIQPSIMRGGITLPQQAQAVAPQQVVNPDLVMPQGPVQAPQAGDISAAPNAPQPAPGDLVTAPLPNQQLPPGQPLDRETPDIVVGRQQDPQSGMIIQTNKDPQTGETYQTTVDPRTGQTVGISGRGGATIPGMSPEDNAIVAQSNQVLAKPPVTYEQLYGTLVRSGVKLTPKNRLAVESHFKDLVKEDQEKRQMALDNIKTRMQMAERRSMEPGKIEEVAVSVDAKGRTLYQAQRYNREKGVFEAVGVPHTKEASVAVNLSPGEQEEQKLSAKQVIEKDSIALEGDATLDSQIATAKLLNKDMIGGSFAAEHMAINTLASGLGILSKDQEQTLANSRQYGKLLNQFVISYINEKLFPQRVTNVDLQFLSKVTPEQGYSQEARDAILDMMKHYNDYHASVVQGRIDYYGEHGTIRGYKPPRLTPFFKPGPKEAGQVPVAPRTMNWDELNAKP